ncbi:MAG: hypothetical protein WCV84_01780 [Patescibacteria group bacterium]
MNGEQRPWLETNEATIKTAVAMLLLELRHAMLRTGSATARGMTVLDVRNGGNEADLRRFADQLAWLMAQGSAIWISSKSRDVMQIIEGNGRGIVIVEDAERLRPDAQAALLRHAAHVFLHSKFLFFTRLSPDAVQRIWSPPFAKAVGRWAQFPHPDERGMHKDSKLTFTTGDEPRLASIVPDAPRGSRASTPSTPQQ